MDEGMYFCNGGIRKKGIEGFVVMGWGLLGRFFGQLSVDSCSMGLTG